MSDNNVNLNTNTESSSTNNTDVSNNPVDASNNSVDASNNPVDASNNPVDDETDIADDVTSVTSNIFTTNNMFLLLWFLAIYIIVYYVLGMFFNKGSEPSNFQSSLGRTLDIIFIVSFFIFIISYYTSTSKSQVESDMKMVFNETISFLSNETSIVSILLFIITLYIVVYLFRIPMTSTTKPFFISLLESTAWISLITSIIVVTIQKIFDVNILDYLNETEEPEEEDQPAVTLPLDQDEVFNVSNNKYTYEDAQAVCTSFGAKLATYDQIEAAYNNGAEWCNYGWSDGQMAYFPTQKDTWNELQKHPKKKNNCGRPGVNGGYIDNPYVKFGINCYGKRPAPTDDDKDRLYAKQTNPIPMTAEDKELNEKIEYWKKNSKKLEINSFNNTNWSKY